MLPQASSCLIQASCGRADAASTTTPRLTIAFKTLEAVGHSLLISVGHCWPGQRGHAFLSPRRAVVAQPHAAYVTHLGAPPQYALHAFLCWHRPLDAFSSLMCRDMVQSSRKCPVKRHEPPASHPSLSFTYRLGRLLRAWQSANPPRPGPGHK